MTEKETDAAGARHAPPSAPTGRPACPYGCGAARRIVLVAMIAVMALLALMDAARFFWKGWLLPPPEPARADKARQITAALSDAVSLVPEGSTILVLVTPADYRELAYVFYHAPAAPEMPLKLPLSSPENQTGVPYEGRNFVFAWYDESRPVDVAKTLAAYNAHRSEGRFGGAVVVSWRGETAFALLYDAEGKEAK